MDVRDVKVSDQLRDCLVALITESVLLWVILIVYVLVGYSIAWRVENG